MVKIRHGFVGQRLVVYPIYVIEEALANPLSADLVVHSMGYFPRADGHYIERKNGCGEYILIYCVKGKGYYELKGEQYSVLENQFFVLPSDVPHRYWADCNEPWSIYWIHFKGKKAPPIYEQLRSINDIKISKQSRVSQRIEVFDELLNVMESETRESTVCYVNMAVNHLFATFLYVSEYQKAKYSTEKAVNTSFISLATHYMNENIEVQLTLGDMASNFGYSKSYFYRVFHRETGMSPVAYFQSIKVKRAAELLVNTNLRVNQVALKFGFEDPYYFSRLFKKVMGVAPSAYKLNVRKGDYEY